MRKKRKVIFDVSSDLKMEMEAAYGLFPDAVKAIEDAVDNLNAVALQAHYELSHAITDYNEIVNKINRIRGDVVTELYDFVDSEPSEWAGTTEHETTMEVLDTFDGEMWCADDPADFFNEVDVHMWHGYIDDYEWKVEVWC